MRHGVLLIDKPEGCTSHDVVAEVRRILHERSVGHLGTLDPMATGLLPLVVGRKALKIVEFFLHREKSYEALLRLGAVSSTYDREGVIDVVPPRTGWSPPSTTQLQEVLQSKFIGSCSQLPPSHSAIRVAGQRAYVLARRGRPPPLERRQVHIFAVRILSYVYPDLRLAIDCGAGTYIRSLAHDLGQILRCGAYLQGLRRTRVGDWGVAEARRLPRISWADVLPLKAVLANSPRIDLTPEEYQDVSHGRSVSQRVDESAFGWYEDLPVAVLIPDPHDSARARPRKVL